MVLPFPGIHAIILFTAKEGGFVMTIEDKVFETATKKAKMFVSENSRIADTPIRFEVHVVYNDNEKPIVKQLTADVTPLPAWRWPVLDFEASVAALKAAIDESLEKGIPVSMELYAVKGTDPAHFIQSFVDYGNESFYDPNPLKRRPSYSWQVHQLKDLAKRIADYEISKAGEGRRAVIATSVDTAVRLDDDLNEHLQYAMDGSGSILWSGTAINHYPNPTPEDIDEAVKQEVFDTGRDEEIFIVGGVVVDIGDGKGLIKGAHRIATVDIS